MIKIIESLNEETSNVGELPATKIIWGDRVKLVKDITVEKLYNLVNEYKTNRNYVYFPIYVEIDHMPNASRKGRFGRVTIKPDDTEGSYKVDICKSQRDAYFTSTTWWDGNKTINCYIPRDIDVNAI